MNNIYITYACRTICRSCYIVTGDKINYAFLKKWPILLRPIVWEALRISKEFYTMLLSIMLVLI